MIVAAIFALTACVTHGQKFDMADAEAFQPGITTLSDAELKFGKPRSVSYQPDGSKLVQWMFVQVVYVHATSGHIAILFDKDGKMVRLTHKSGT